VQGARADVLAFYRGARDELTPAAADYLAYLTALDLLVLRARRNRSIAKSPRPGCAADCSVTTRR